MSVISIDKDKINVSRQTIYSWLKEKDVMAELDEQRQQLKKNRTEQNHTECMHLY